MTAPGLLPTLLQFLLSGLVVGLVYSLAAIAYTTIFNVTGVINFAQGDMAMVPAMVAISTYDAGFGLAAAAGAALATGALLGVLLDRLVVAPLQGHVLRTTVATIGTGIVLQGAAVVIFGTEARTLPSLLGDWRIVIGGAALPGQSAVVVAAAILLVGLLSLLFQGSYLGRAFRACAVNPYAARLSGIHVPSMRLLACVLAGLVSAVVGVIVTPLTLMQYDSGVAIGIKGFIACIIGGLGNPLGAIAGGLLLGVLESFATWGVGSGYKTAISLATLIGFLLLRPSGLLRALEGPAA